MEFQAFGRWMLLWASIILFVPSIALSKYFYYPMYYPRRIAHRHIIEFVPFPVVKTEVLFVEKDPKDDRSPRTPSKGKNKGFVPYPHFKSEDKEIVRELVHDNLGKVQPKMPSGSNRIPFSRPSWSNPLSVTSTGDHLGNDSWRPISIQKPWDVSNRIPNEEVSTPKRMRCKCEADDSK